jgi:hypothetical protein
MFRAKSKDFARILLYCASALACLLVALIFFAQTFQAKAVSIAKGGPENRQLKPGTASVLPALSHRVVDFNGDGKSDFVTIRNTGGGVSGQVTWYYLLNGGSGSGGANWGIASDFFVPADYDGDGKADESVWRPGPAGSAVWYTLLSSTNTLQQDVFGQSGDDPTVVYDYDGDGKADLAVYRAGLNTGDQSVWYFKGSFNNPNGAITFVPWGVKDDFPAPGDYDGDGKGDFVIQRDNGNGQARFWELLSNGTANSFVFGLATDVIAPGDYDGDGKTDIAVLRGLNGQINWFVMPSTNPGTYLAIAFGSSATDYPVQGDYDGDGKTDFAVWRPSGDTTPSYFYYVQSSNSALGITAWGSTGDYPAANFNTH